jgi:hypothetical protein
MTLQDRLRALRGNYFGEFGNVIMRQEVIDELDRLQAENEALREDALRYRWLRIESAQGWNLFGHYTQDALDAAIDDAMK